MSRITLSNNSGNMFFVELSEIQERLDPFFYKKEFLELMNKLNNNVLSSDLKSIKAYIKKGVFDMSPENYVVDGVPFLRVSDITYEGMDFSSTVFINEKTHNDELKTEFTPGDIVIAKIGHTIGKVSVLPDTYDKYNISQNVIGIKLSEQIRKKLNPFYLKVFLTSDIGKKQVIRNSSQGGQPKITLDAIRKIILPIFNLEKQEKIVSIYYDSLNEKKRLEIRAIDLLKSIDSYLLDEFGITMPQKENSLNNRIFTTKHSELSGNRFDPFYNDVFYLEIENQIDNCNFPLKNIKDLCYAVSGVVYSGKDQRQEGKGILRANNIDLDTNELNLNDIRFVRDDLEISSNLLLKKDDILISTASGSKEHVGKVAYITEDLDYYFGGFMSVLRKKQADHNQRFLFEFLQSSIFRMYLYKNLGGTNINNLSFNMIANLKVPFPSPEKQKEIVNHILNIRKECKRLQKEATDLVKETKYEIEKIILGE